MKQRMLSPKKIAKQTLGSLTRYGTYGFLSALMAAQLSLSPRALGEETSSEKAADKVDRAATDAKKSARELKKDLKKGARKATGTDNEIKDVRDEVKDGAKDLKDEANYQKRKIERKAD